MSGLPGQDATKAWAVATAGEHRNSMGARRARLEINGCCCVFFAVQFDPSNRELSFLTMSLLVKSKFLDQIEVGFNLPRIDSMGLGSGIAGRHEAFVTEACVGHEADASGFHASTRCS